MIIFASSHGVRSSAKIILVLFACRRTGEKDENAETGTNENIRVIYTLPLVMYNLGTQHKRKG